MIKDTYREWIKARSHFFTDFRSLDKDERDQFISLCQIADPETGQADAFFFNDNEKENGLETKILSRNGFLLRSRWAWYEDDCFRIQMLDPYLENKSTSFERLFEKDEIEKVLRSIGLYGLMYKCLIIVNRVFRFFFQANIFESLPSTKNSILSLYDDEEEISDVEEDLILSKSICIGYKVELSLDLPYCNLEQLVKMEEGPSSLIL